MSTEKLESSILTGAFIACNKCSKVDAEEGLNATDAAKVFHDDGWRVVNDLALCPGCVDKLNTEHEKN